MIPHHRINLPPYADVCFCVTGRASMSALVIRSPYFFGRPRWRFAGGSGIRNSALSRRICPITAMARSTAQSTSRRFMYHASRTTRTDGKWLAMAPSSALAIVIFPGFPSALTGNERSGTARNRPAKSTMLADTVTRT